MYESKGATLCSPLGFTSKPVNLTLIFQICISRHFVTVRPETGATAYTP